MVAKIRMYFLAKSLASLKALFLRFRSSFRLPASKNSRKGKKFHFAAHCAAGAVARRVEAAEATRRAKREGERGRDGVYEGANKSVTADCRTAAASFMGIMAESERSEGEGIAKKPDKCIDCMLQQKPKRSSDDKFPAAAALQRGSVCLIDSL